jgi:hypothetical protein
MGRPPERLEDGAKYNINRLNAELIPTCHLLALLKARHILHVSRMKVKMIPESIKA